MRIDGGKIAENTLFTVLMEAKDEEVIRLLTTAVKKRTSGETEYKNPGINMLSDIIIFEVDLHNERITGLIFNLLNEKAFLKNIDPGKSSRFSIQAKDRVGLLLIAPQKSKVSEKQLTEYGSQLLSKRQSSHQFKDHSASASKLIDLHVHKPVSKSSHSFHEIDLSFEQSQHSIELEGFMSAHSGLESHYLSHQVVPSGLHITSRIFAQEWADSLKRILSFLPVDLPEITAFSMNYFGANVVNHSSGFFVIPQMELVIQCKDEFSINDLFSKGSLRSELDYELSKNEIKIQNERLFFKQLSPNSFYIGTNTSPAFSKPDSKTALQLKGSLSPLIEVKGGGLMTAFLEMIPAFKASRVLSDNTELVDLHITKKNDKQCEIKGELKFKPDRYPTSEILRFLLNSEIID